MPVDIVHVMMVIAYLATWVFIAHMTFSRQSETGRHEPRRP